MQNARPRRFQPPMRSRVASAKGVDVVDVVRVLADPALDLSARHLGMELDAPRRLAQPVRLREPSAARELGRSGKLHV